MAKRIFVESNPKFLILSYQSVFSQVFLLSFIDETVFPFAAALVFVWDTLAMSMELPRKELSVKFHEVHFHTQPFVYDERLLKIGVELHRGTGWFEVGSYNPFE